jgi:hypothetical protein
MASQVRRRGAEGRGAQEEQGAGHGGVDEREDEAAERQHQAQAGHQAGQAGGPEGAQERAPVADRKHQKQKQRQAERTVEQDLPDPGRLNQAYQNTAGAPEHAGQQDQDHAAKRGRFGLRRGGSFAHGLVA